LAPYPNGWTLAIKALSFFGGGAEEAAGSWQHFFGDFWPSSGGDLYVFHV